MFIGTTYLDIYTLTNNDVRYEKMFTKQAKKKKKPIRWTFLVGYSDNIVSSHSLTDLNSKSSKRFNNSSYISLKSRMKDCLKL